MSRGTVSRVIVGFLLAGCSENAPEALDGGALDAGVDEVGVVDSGADMGAEDLGTRDGEMTLDGALDVGPEDLGVRIGTIAVWGDGPRVTKECLGAAWTFVTDGEPPITWRLNSPSEGFELEPDDLSGVVVARTAEAGSVRLSITAVDARGAGGDAELEVERRSGAAWEVFEREVGGLRI